VVVSALALSGCEPRDLNAELRSNVEEFHRLYNSQSFGAIYDGSSRLFRRRMSRAASNKTFADLYARDGRVVSTKRVSEGRDTQFGSQTFLLTYTTKFERGTFSEFIGYRESLTEERGVLLAVYERD
jgi:hypothetical protein